ncbi:hypothetical protein ACLRGI_22615 [Paenarthrobacter nitroguajacolicus]|uniref:hypothetical protein n=1 Tax=Paenarthrobacter nitroguajacolicus TaxID=211146 RepID=UPI003AED8F4E
MDTTEEQNPTTMDTTEEQNPTTGPDADWFYALDWDNAEDRRLANGGHDPLTDGPV